MQLLFETVTVTGAEVVVSPESLVATAVSTSVPFGYLRLCQTRL